MHISRAGLGMMPRSQSVQNRQLPVKMARTLGQDQVKFGATAELKLFNENGSGTKFEGIVVLDGRRTPFGKQGGSLRDYTESDMATVATKGALEAAGIDGKQITNSIWGNVIPSSDQTAYLSRDVLLRTGAKLGTPAHNTNKLCGSGMFVVGEAAKDLALLKDTSQDAIYLVGGSENMSSAPFGSFKMLNHLADEVGATKKSPFGMMVKYRKALLKNLVKMLMGKTSPPRVIQREFTKDLTRAMTDAFAEDFGAMMKMGGPTSKLQFMTLLREGLTHKGTKDQPIDHGMIDTAEKLRKRFIINNDELDQYSVQSQHRAATAWASHKFDDEVVPVTDADGKVVTARDEHMRPTTKLSSLAKLRKRQGDKSKIHRNPADAVHTAANASGIVDGAVALLLTNQETADRLGKKPLGNIVSVGEVGVNPKIMGLGAAKGGEVALKTAGLKFSDIDLFEVNEAFASVGLSTEKRWAAELAQEKFESWLAEEAKKPEFMHQSVQEREEAQANKFDQLLKEATVDIHNRTNINGGAIAVGHPLGATGARLVLTMMKELQRQNKRYGLISACVGGGQGVGVVVENPDARPNKAQ